MENELTIQDVLALLPDKNANDLRKAFDAPDLVTTVETFLVVVVEEPKNWLRSLPSTWKSLSNFEHVRAAVTAVTKLDAVVAAYPKLVKDFKAMMKAGKLNRAVLMNEVDRRMAADENDQDDNQVDDDEDDDLIPERPFTERLKAGCIKFCKAEGNNIHHLLTECWRDSDDCDDSVVDIARCVFKDSSDILEALLKCTIAPA